MHVIRMLIPAHDGSKLVMAAGTQKRGECASSLNSKGLFNKVPANFCMRESSSNLSWLEMHLNQSCVRNLGQRSPGFSHMRMWTACRELSAPVSWGSPFARFCQVSISKHQSMPRSIGSGRCWARLQSWGFNELANGRRCVRFICDVGSRPGPCPQHAGWVAKPCKLCGRVAEKLLGQPLGVECPRWMEGCGHL